MYCFEKQVERTHEQSLRDGISQTGLDVFLLILGALFFIRSKSDGPRIKASISFLTGESKRGLSRIVAGKKATLSLCSSLSLIVRLVKAIFGNIQGPKQSLWKSSIPQVMCGRSVFCSKSRKVDVFRSLPEHFYTSV